MVSNFNSDYESGIEMVSIINEPLIENWHMMVPTLSSSYSVDDLRKQLKESACLVVFEKTDGTVREMWCTLMKERLPVDKDGKPQSRKPPNNNVISVFDLEKLDWRAFRLDKIVEYYYPPKKA